MNNLSPGAVQRIDPLKYERAGIGGCLVDELGDLVARRKRLDRPPVSGGSFLLPPASGLGGCCLLRVSGNAPNRDTHTIKIRATDQRHVARLTAGNTQGRHTPLCWISKGTRYHSVPCHPLCHPGPATAYTVSKKGLLLRCPWYWIRPPADA